MVPILSGLSVVRMRGGYDAESTDWNVEVEVALGVIICRENTTSVSETGVSESSLNGHSTVSVVAVIVVPSPDE